MLSKEKNHLRSLAAQTKFQVWLRRQQHLKQWQQWHQWHHWVSSNLHRSKNRHQCWKKGAIAQKAPPPKAMPTPSAPAAQTPPPPKVASAPSAPTQPVSSAAPTQPVPEPANTSHDPVMYLPHIAFMFCLSCFFGWLADNKHWYLSLVWISIAIFSCGYHFEIASSFFDSGRKSSRITRCLHMWPEPSLNWATWKVAECVKWRSCPSAAIADTKKHWVSSIIYILVWSPLFYFSH